MSADVCVLGVLYMLRVDIEYTFVMVRVWVRRRGYIASMEVLVNIEVQGCVLEGEQVERGSSHTADTHEGRKLTSAQILLVCVCVCVGVHVCMSAIE